MKYLSDNVNVDGPSVSTARDESFASGRLAMVNSAMGVPDKCNTGKIREIRTSPRSIKAIEAIYGCKGSSRATLLSWSVKSRCDTVPCTASKQLAKYARAFPKAQLLQQSSTVANPLASTAVTAS